MSDGKGKVFNVLLFTSRNLKILRVHTSKLKYDTLYGTVH